LFAESLVIEEPVQPEAFARTLVQQIYMEVTPVLQAIFFKVHEPEAAIPGAQLAGHSCAASRCYNVPVSAPPPS